MIVTNHYDIRLRLITGCSTEPCFVSEGLTFLEHLYFIFSSYPKIQKNYPPGFLGFTVNGKKPTDFTILQDGDQIFFYSYLNIQ